MGDSASKMFRDNDGIWSGIVCWGDAETIAAIHWTQTCGPLKELTSCSYIFSSSRLEKTCRLGKLPTNN